MSDKNEAEEEYFARQSREQQAKLAAEVAAEKARSERAALQALHAQRCGKCGGALKAQNFRGVEIDVCEDCGSVLLDPGELEQLAGSDESGAVKSLAALFSFARKK